MKTILSNEKIQVYDDLLSEDQLEALWVYMNQIEYQPANVERWHKVWNLSDGVMLRGTQWLAQAPDWSLTPIKAVDVAPNALDVSALSNFLAAVLQATSRNKQLKKLRKVVLIPYVWPPLTSISWHTDGPGTASDRLGAFTFYAHKRWNSEWGGEFMTSSAKFKISPQDWRVFDNSATSDAIQDRGMGMWFSPKPNRLMVNANQMLHRVNKVSASAEARMSIQGFFYR